MRIMASARQRWLRVSIAVMSVAAFVSTAVSGVSGQCRVDGITDGFAGSGVSSGNFLPGSPLTPQECAAACFELDMASSAVEDGSYCWCYSAAHAAALTAVSGCVSSCVGGEQCGGPDGQVTVMAATALSTPPATVTSTQSPLLTLGGDGTAMWRLTGETPKIGAEFVVNVGDGSADMIIGGTDTSGIKSTFDQLLTFVSIGRFTVTVAARVDGVMGPAASQEITVLPAVAVHQLECPDVVSPGEQFFCSLVVTGQTAQFTATFSDDNTVLPLASVVSEFLTVGHAPVQAHPHPSVVINSSPSSFTIRQPFTGAGKLAMIRWLGAGTGSCEYHVMRPRCSISGHGVCLSEARCGASCPSLSHTQFSCPAQFPVVCIKSTQCSSDEQSSATCGQNSPFVLDENVHSETISVTASMLGNSRPTSEVWTQPGDVIKVQCSTGSIAHTVVADGQGDLDGALNNRRHLIEVVTVPAASVSFSHTCTSAPISFTVLVQSGLVPATSQSATVHCQIAPVNLSVALEQQAVRLSPADPSAIGDDYIGQFYINAAEPFTVTVSLSEAAPVQLDYWLANDNTTSATQSINRLVLTSDIFSQQLNVNSARSLALRVGASNRHASSLVKNASLVVQHPVLAAWRMVEAVDSEGILRPPLRRAVPEFQIRLASSLQLPTDAVLDVSFGDGQQLHRSLLQLGLLDSTPPTEAIDGDFVANFSAQYIAPGVYQIAATISNQISSVSNNMSIKIIESIETLNVLIKQQIDRTTPQLETGFGESGKSYYFNQNLTISVDLTQGTIDTLSIYNSTTSSLDTLLHTHVFSDPFNPAIDSIQLSVDQAQLLNLSFVAINPFQTVTTHLTDINIMEPLGVITSLSIEETNNSVTSDGEDKSFTINFSAPSAQFTCLVLDFGDLSPLASYGDEDVCAQNASNAVYMPQPLTQPMIVSHTYWKKGMFNASALIVNSLSYQEALVMFMVTDFPCQRPLLNLTGTSYTLDNPPAYWKSQSIVLGSSASLECTATLKTKKRWQLFEIDPTTGAILKPMYILNVIPSWNRSDLLIPPAFLPVGMFKALYTITMQQSDVLPQELTFQTQKAGYFSIVPSPLRAGFILGATSMVRRSWGQTLSLDGDTFSYDGDAISRTSFSYKWYCLRSNETLPKNDSGYIGAPLQMFVNRSMGSKSVSNDNGGCFGEGPGQLNFTGPVLMLNTGHFQPQLPGSTYDIIMVIENNGRMGETSISVVMTAENVPITSIIPSDPLLLFPVSGGLAANAQNDIGLRGICLEMCAGSLSYDWSIFMVDDDKRTVINAVSYISPSVNAEEIRISKRIFADYANVSKFYIELRISEEGKASFGSSGYIITVNMAPILDEMGCACSPDPFTAVVDLVNVRCPKAVDPDGDPVTKYVFSAHTTDVNTFEVKEEIVAVQKTPEASVQLGYGKVSMFIDVEDDKGAVSRKLVCNMTLSLLPNSSQLKDYMHSKDVLQAGGTGDSRKMATMMLALASVRKNSPSMSLAGKSESERMRISESAAKENIDALETISNMALDSKDSVNLMANAVSAILGQGLEDPLMIDSRTAGLATKSLSEIGDQFDRVNFVSHNEMEGSMSSIGNIAGIISSSVASVAADDNCASVSLADVSQADTFFYENILDYDSETIIPDADTQRRCNARDQTMKDAGLVSDQLDKTIKNIETAALRKMLVNESMHVTSPSGVEISLYMANNASGSVFSTDHAQVQLPTNFAPGSNESVAVAIAEIPRNSRVTAKNAGDLSPSSRVVSIDIKSRCLSSLNITNLDEDITLIIPRNSVDEDFLSVPLTSINISDYLKDKFISIVYTEFSILHENSAFNIELYPLDMEEESVVILIDYSRMPTLRNYSHIFLLSDLASAIRSPAEDIDADARYDLFVSSDLVANRSGKSYIGVAQLNSTHNSYQQVKDSIKAGTLVSGILQQPWILANIPRGSYKIRTYTTSCVFYNAELDSWSGEGLKAVASGMNFTRCQTSHLSSFSSGLFVQPNSIDFAYVLAHASFNENMTIYMTIILSLTIMALLFVWARWQDKKDTQRIGITPLTDNRKSDKYLYEIVVFTGHKANAACDSNISFFISGDIAETRIRSFGAHKRRFFRKGGQDAFVMACPSTLGKPQYLKIWHDSSGKGRYASWFLNYFFVRDVQSGETTTFMCNQWMAVEEADGQLDRLVPAAGKEQMQSFAHTFPHRSQETLSDGHLWFSVFLRPPRSRFTRCQRVMCCFVLLFMSMMVNAMWYGTVPSKPDSGSLNFGPLSVSVEQISVGIMSNLIVFVPSVAIVFLFRRARPRVLNQSRIEKAMKTSSVDHEKSASESIDTPAPTKIKSLKKTKSIPWWWRVVAWAICLICLATSIFIIWSYGIQFGDEKTTKWISSMLVSFFASIMFTQPAKVFLTALVLSAIFKDFSLESDDASEDEVPPNLSDSEEWLPIGAVSTQQQKLFSPLRPELLKKLRERRLKEVKMWEILREICTYALFLWILIVLSYDNRDPNAYYLQKNLKNAFIKEGDYTGFKRSLDFSKVKTTKDFWVWAREVIMPELRAQTWYDNLTPAYGLRGFLDDRVNRIMGYGIMRQIRSKRGTCSVYQDLTAEFDSCQGYSSLINEDQVNYCSNWTLSGGIGSCSRPEYRHNDQSTVGGLPFIGRMDIYSGGGYIFKMTGRQNDVLHKMQQLEDENWIDSDTRAVFVEFSVYNAQVNLFGTATIFVEVSPGGGMHPGWRFDGIRLTRHQSNAMAFLVICEIAYVLFIIYFIVRESRHLLRLKGQYFKQYHVYAEWSIITLSIVAFVLYIIRYVETSRLLSHFKRTYGNAFIRLQYAQAIDDTFGYLVAIIVFVSTLKFIRVLRFNKRLGMLSATLKHTWNDLAGFIVIFLIAIGSFGVLFHLLLVTSMSDFRTFMSSLESCFAMMLGKFKFSRMYEGSYTSAAMFFVFALYMNLIFVNVLLTIILNGFEKVKRDISKQPNDYELVDFLVSRFLGFFRSRPATVKPSQITDMAEKHTNWQAHQLNDKFNECLDKFNKVHLGGKLSLSDSKQTKINAQ